MNPIIGNLINLGERISLGDEPPATLLQNLRSQSKTCRFFGPNSEENLNSAKLLDEKSLELLIKGLTIAERAERDRGWGAGSVTGVPILFDYYCSEFCFSLHQIGGSKSLGDKSQKLADWILKNTNNPYVPFGYYKNGGSKSYKEFLEYQNRVREAIAARERHNEASEMEKQDLKKKKQEKARLHDTEGAEKSIQREIFLAEFSSKSIKQKLDIILSKNSQPLDYYPQTFADEIVANIDDISHEDLLKLKKIIDRRKKGPWSKLSKIIEALGI